MRIRLRIAEGKGPSLRIQRVPGAHVLQHLMRQTLVGLFNAVEQAVAILAVDLVPRLAAEVHVVLFPSAKGPAMPSKNFMIYVAYGLILPAPQLFFREQTRVAVGNDEIVVDAGRQGCRHDACEHHSEKG